MRPAGPLALCHPDQRGVSVVAPGRRTPAAARVTPPGPAVLALRAVVKVRIGVALGGRGTLALDGLGPAVDRLEALGFDSIWLPETFLTGSVDPLVGLSWIAARAPHLKLGTHLIGPGRNPFALAKALAQLDVLSRGRLLVTMVPGLNDPAERRAQGLPDGDRNVWIDRHLPELRAWWAGDEVDGLALDSLPAQDPLEVWVGGRSPAAFARAGRLADGWLPGGLTIAEATAGMAAVRAAASTAGRAISDEHFGTNLTYADGDPTLIEAASSSMVGDRRDVLAADAEQLRTLVGRWVDAGFSKFVVRPLGPATDQSLGRLADAVLDLQT